MQIEVHFLGKPEIYIDGQRVVIPQKKLQALFLYLLFNENCTRDELAFIFWEERDGETARKNLRNSLYKLKSIVGEGIFLTDGNEYVNMNPALELVKDTDVFIMENGGKYMIHMENYVFLDKFSVKNCGEFEKWVSSIQNIYEKMFVDRLLPAMKKSFESEDYVLAENCARKILTLDAYQEMACQVLLQVYSVRGEYNKAIYSYTSFADTLKRDMEVKPEERTKELYEKVLLLKKRHQEEGQSGVYRGHLEAVAELQQEYRKYRRREESRVCILCGSVGMGKTMVLREFMESMEDMKLINVEFQVSNQSVSYFAVEKIVEKICERCRIAIPQGNPEMVGMNGDIYYRNRIELTMKAVVRKGQRYVLLLRNMESVDEQSLNLLMSSFFEKYKKDFFMLIEYCPNFQSQPRLLSRLAAASDVKVVELNPLSEEESREYLINALGDRYPKCLSSRKIYEFTGGNLQFLKDTAERIRQGEEEYFTLQPQTRCTLERLFSGFRQDEYEYLEYLSVLEHGASVQQLAQMLEEKPVAIMKMLDSLMHRKLLCETSTGWLRLVKLREKMVRDLIYQRTSQFKRIELHNLAIRYYEQVYQENRNIYFYLSELRYHYQFTEREYEKLYYDIANLQYTLDYYDEFFPTVINDEDTRNSIRLDRERIYQSIEDCTERLESMEDDIEFRSYEELRMILDFLKGRSLTRDGKRKKGILHIQDMMKRAKELERTDMLLKGYVELICYGLKENNAKWMETYLEEAQRTENLDSFAREKGVLLRLGGYCNILKKEYEKAENLLTESIALFESPKMRRANYFNVAGAYDYLAVIYRNRGDFGKAEAIMEKAIQLCHEKKVSKSLDLLYEDYGYILYLQGKYDEAEKYFLLSAGIYDEFGTYWLRSVGESCMAVIALYRKEEEKALEHFRRAEIFSQKDMTIEELEILEDTRSKLREARVLSQYIE